MTKKACAAAIRWFRWMHNENDTLVICTPGFPSSEADSTCLPMQQSLIRTLQKSNPWLRIIVLAFQYPYHNKRYQWFGIPVIPFNGQNKGGLKKLLLRKRINAELNSIKEQSRIIGLLSFWVGECAYLAKRFADQNGLRHFCWILGQDAKKDNRYADRMHLKAGELVALSDFVQDEFEKNHGVRPEHLIPPGIDPGQYGGTITDRDIDIIGAGSLIPLKQYEAFIGVIASLKQRMPAIKAVIAGNGPERTRLMKLIHVNQLEKNLILLGELSHAEVLRYMERSKLFLHTSAYEGFGVVMSEALGAGCRVISFCKPMKREVDQWHIVQQKEEMAQRAGELLFDPATTYERTFLFTAEDMARQMIDLFSH
jgi:glycosyltransferase involved in cell wall biosynthesis